MEGLGDEYDLLDIAAAGVKLAHHSAQAGFRAAMVAGALCYAAAAIAAPALLGRREQRHDEAA